MPADLLFRIIVIGDPGVGKSSIVKGLNSDKINKDYAPTIGIDFAINTRTICDKTIKTQIWDTAGQEYFRSIIRNYYNDVCAAILVYDITNLKSFEKISWWLKELDTFKNSRAMPNMMLIGNKLDLNKKRAVSYQDGYDFAIKNNMMFFETSAWDHINIESFLDSLLIRIFNNRDSFKHGIRKYAHKEDLIRFNPESKKNKKKCCRIN
jgi:small GTP-binding protein